MPPGFDQDVAKVVADIDHTLRQMDQTTLNRQGQIHTLGKLLLFDLGNLKLTDQEEDDLVAFLKTLTDDYKLPSPRAAK